MHGRAQSHLDGVLHVADRAGKALAHVVARLGKGGKLALEILKDLSAGGHLLDFLVGDPQGLGHPGILVDGAVENGPQLLAELVHGQGDGPGGLGHQRGEFYDLIRLESGLESGADAFLQGDQ